METLRKYKPHILELALVIGCYLVYVQTRGLIYPDTTVTGIANAEKIVALEQGLGFFWEPGLQAWALEQSSALAIFFNWVYIATYWPVILLFGAILFFNERPVYYYYRTVILISLIIALVTFALFPVASPFNLTEHLSNTIQDFGPSYYGSPQMAVFYNTNAAMPSLHFCWTAVLGVSSFQRLKGGFRLLGLAYPMLTFLSITITGNHFILDAMAGGLLAAISFGLTAMWNRFFARVGSPGLVVRRPLPPWPSQPAGT